MIALSFMNSLLNRNVAYDEIKSYILGQNISLNMFWSILLHTNNLSCFVEKAVDSLHN